MITEPFKLKEVTYLSLKQWEVLLEGLTVGFSTKVGGVSQDAYSTLNLGLHVHDQPNRVLKNRSILAKKTSYSLNNWVFAEQVHSTYIQKVTNADCGRGLFSYEEGIANCDGFYTSEKDVMLSLCFADCVPIYFFAPKEPLIGIAHAGWKGTVRNIGGNMVTKWKDDEGIHPGDIKVAIGPSIGSCCYVVDERVVSQIDQLSLNKYHLPYTAISKGQYTLDLKELNKYLLIEAGIKEENIEMSQYCTSCEEELFFSHRRDKGTTGRMLGFIGLK